MATGFRWRGPTRADRGSVRRRRRDPQPQRPGGVAKSADERDLAQDAARGGRGAVRAQLEVAAALDARRGTGVALDDGSGGDVDRAVGGGAGELACDSFGAADLFAEGAGLLASGAAGARHRVVTLL
jgi:hypothetical protein